MFGISFTEIAVIALVTLIVVGPQKLPSMLYTLGRWIRKLRKLTTEVRAQTGIDDILRQEGFEGGLGELRSMLRGDIEVGRGTRRYEDAYEDPYELDQSREYPPEGADAAGALPDDLVDEEEEADADAEPAEAEAAPAGGAKPGPADAPAEPAGPGGAPPWKGTPASSKPSKPEPDAAREPAPSEPKSEPRA